MAKDFWTDSGASARSMHVLSLLCHVGYAVSSCRSYAYLRGVMLTRGYPVPQKRVSLQHPQEFEVRFLIFLVGRVKVRHAQKQTPKGSQKSPNFRILYYTILYYTILYYTILYYTILYYTIVYYTILYYTMLYYTILYYTILYYTILYYTILYYTILY